MVQFESGLRRYLEFNLNWLDQVDLTVGDCSKSMVYI